VTLTILQRSVHFITSPHRASATLALQVLTRGLPALARRDDELLPLVHAAWAPLVARFHSSEPVVLRRAFDLLVTLAALSKDFIRSRTVKEVLPEIYKFLHKSAKDSYLKDTGSYYRSSQAYSLQVSALEALPSLASDLGLEDESLAEAMSCTLAVSFFKKMLQYEYGAAWYHLRGLCNNEAVLEPPPLTLLPLERVVGTPTQARDQDYDTNVKLIFDMIS
ncbi:putative tel2-interacting protein 1, partial [Operophtera brumata]